MAVKERIEARALTDRGAAPWALASERLEQPERPRTYWLATVRDDGRPHVMPIIGMWMDDAFHFVSGEQTLKGRNLAREPRCVVVTGSTTLPSLDLIVDGVATIVTDEAELQRVTEAYRTRMEWPLEVRDGRVHGPNAPTAGPPPYAVWRIAPSSVIGLPGMLGMEQFDPEELPRPTKWAFPG
jgi:nitroimidazol reductase NimA-like FMN-containing flavoprotein (pyridoxamine 5'-phosphate oxidase superfamily)